MPITTIVVPGSSPTAQADRDGQIAELQSLFSTSPWKFRRYIDASPLGAWAYLATCYVYTSGILTTIKISCSGMAHPPSGSNLATTPDPGVGIAYSWTLVGAMPIISASDDRVDDKSIPSLSPNIHVWRIPGNSSTAPADFTAAINKIIADTPLTGNTYWNYYKYIDVVSSAWAVYALGLYMNSAATPVEFLVTSSGTPNPPTGSSAPAVALPAFTQPFIAISAPINFGPSR